MIYLSLFFEFFKIGLFCFGGAFGMIPLIRETVVAHNWLTEDALYSFIGVCESTPGPIAVNIATYVGSVQGGLLGSICATLGVVTPSFIIILLIASVLKHFSDNKYFKAFLKGVKPVIVALILSTGVILLAGTLGFGDLKAISPDVCTMAVFALLIAIYFIYGKIRKKKLSSIMIILISAVLGIGVCLLRDAVMGV